MEFDLQNDPCGWFLFGVAVMAHLNEVPRDTAVWDKVEACLKEIADGDTTLADSADEAKRRLPPASPEVQAEFLAKFGVTPDEFLRRATNRGVRAQRQRAAFMLEVMQNLKLE